MAACPTLSAPGPFSSRPRRPVTQRKIDANRGNARHSTGPRTPDGKAKVSRNAVKHCLFASPERWGEIERREFAEALAGLNQEYRPASAEEARCIEAIASSVTRLAALMRFESREAIREHQRRQGELEDAIAAASSEDEADAIREHRERLKQNGLWAPTLPGPRAARVVIRYEGRLNREFYAALSRLEEIRKRKLARGKIARTNPARGGRGASPRDVKVQKQTQTVEQSRGFSYQRHPAADAAIASTTDLAGIFGGPAPHLTEVDRIILMDVNCANGKNAKTNPNYVAKTYTIPARFKGWIQR